MAQDKKSDEGGCWACLGGMVLIALVIAAVISIAALIDPFDWMPSVSEVWEDCETEVYGSDECDLDERFPGFWWHVVANFAWALVETVLLIGVIASAADVREARVARFDSEEAAAQYAEKRGELGGLAVLAGAVAAVPILVTFI